MMMTVYAGRHTHLACCVLAITGCSGVCSRSTAAHLRTVHLQDNGAELTNPGMGWALHYYDNVPRNYGRFSTVSGHFWAILSTDPGVEVENVVP